MDNIPKPASLKGELSAQKDGPSPKVRKPYTITKQRERWTEDEHKRFIEALKLHGRAWRKIEEHIGTKTAVQIRSHAQKFFSKLEREASLGLSGGIGITQDIEVPPPRPKRKPMRPYPRKAGSKFSCSRSAFEGESKTSAATCSSFVPFVGHKKSSLQVLEVSVKEKVLPQSGLSTSLKLFGQTFDFPLPEKYERSTPHMSQANFSSEPVIITTESQSEIEVSAQSVSIPASRKNEDKARGNTPTTVHFQGKIEVAAATESSKVETPVAHVDECDAFQSSNEHSIHASSMVTECSNEGEDSPVVGHCFEKTSPLIEGYAPAFSNSGLHFPVETIAMNCMKHLQEQSIKSPVITDFGSLERLFLDAFQLFLATVQKNLPTHDAARSWPDPVVGSPLHDKVEHAKGVAEASTVSAFMLAAASAWFKLHGVSLPESTPFKGEKVYNHVSVLAAELSSFLSSMYSLEPGIPRKEENSNTACVNTETPEDSEHGTSKEKDKLVACVKQHVPASTAEISQEHNSSSDDVDRERCCKRSLCQTEVGPARKHVKRSFCKRLENNNEARELFCQCNILPSNNEYERNGEEICSSKAYCDTHDSIISNVHGSTFRSSGEKYGDCNIHAFESKADRDHFSRSGIGSRDSGFGTVDGNKGFMLTGDNACMLVNVAETNAQKLTRHSSKKPLDWKQRQLQKLKMDYSVSHNDSLIDQGHFTKNYGNTLLLAESSRTYEEQCPCKIFTEEEKASLNFPSTGLQSTDARTDVNGDAEESLQAESADRCADVAGVLGKEMTPTKTGSSRGFKRYSGAGFVPYSKFLQDAKLKFANQF